MYHGVDVSFHKGFPNWEAAKESGEVNFAILGVTQLYGKDESFEHNYRECRENGIPVGLYKFSYARTPEDSRAEANEIVRILEGRPIQMGVWLDLEWETQQSFGEEKIGDIIEAFREGIEAVGYEFAGIYCNQYWYNTFIPQYAKEKYKFWIASYGREPSGVVNLAGWQYSDSGQIPGFGSQDVDVDMWYDEIPGANMDDEVIFPVVHIPMLTLGSTGEFVKLLQAKLNNRLGSGLAVDGVYGPLTDAAVKKYQEENDLVVDGIVGPFTWDKLFEGEKTVEELAYEVICGLYGNGEARKILLEKAGYHNYEEIQNMVDRFLE